MHNFYQQPGGEDVVFAAEAALLRQNGHDVVEYREDNRRITGMNRIAVAARTVWSHQTQHRLRQVLRDIRCDVAHFHNTFPLISPSAYSACREARVPVVQTLHNYRVLCPAATFFRDQRVCEDCLGKTPPWPSVLHACYRNSHVHTAMAAMMLTVHRWLKTWQVQVDMYIALTEFSRRKFIQGGLPREKIVVKPNFVSPDPGGREGKGEYALFVGRLSGEKGVHILLRAWNKLRDIPLQIIGDGPLLEEATLVVRTYGLRAVDLLGRLPRQEVLALMKRAGLLIFPSELYEGFPVTLAEAFACGVPVIVSRLGAMAEIVDDGHTGLLFNPGDSEDLAAKVRWAMDHPNAMGRMGENARQVYEDKYTPERNYQMLLDIYEQAIRGSRLRMDP